jgi:hypothetical protein
MVKGEAMRKTDRRFNSVWTRIYEIERASSGCASQQQIEHLTYQITNLKKMLVTAGILVESTELEPTLYPVDGKLYAVRKVK